MCTRFVLVYIGKHNSKHGEKIISQLSDIRIGGNHNESYSLSDQLHGAIVDVEHHYNRIIFDLVCFPFQTTQRYIVVPKNY